MLGAHAPQLAARVDEDGLEVGRLATLHRAAELRRDILARFRRQEGGEMAAAHPGVRVPGGSFRRGVHVHEPALHIVETCGHHEAIDQPQVDALQAAGHGAHILG